MELEECQRRHTTADLGAAPSSRGGDERGQPSYGAPRDAGVPEEWASKRTFAIPLSEIVASGKDMLVWIKLLANATGHASLYGV